jgi:hypothetical protein
MSKYIREKMLMSSTEIDHIWEHTFRDIVSFQEGYARAKEEGNIADLESICGDHDYRPVEKNAVTYCQAA